MQLPKARLENWYVDHDQLCGQVYGHPKLRDGADVVTTRVVKWLEKDKVAVTRNTEYTLGSPRKVEAI